MKKEPPIKNPNMTDDISEIKKTSKTYKKPKQIVKSLAAAVFIALSILGSTGSAVAPPPTQTITTVDQDQQIQKQQAKEQFSEAKQAILNILESEYLKIISNDVSGGKKATTYYNSEVSVTEVGCRKPGEYAQTKTIINEGKPIAFYEDEAPTHNPTYKNGLTTPTAEDAKHKKAPNVIKDTIDKVKVEDNWKINQHKNNKDGITTSAVNPETNEAITLMILINPDGHPIAMSVTHVTPDGKVIGYAGSPVSEEAFNSKLNEAKEKSAAFQQLEKTNAPEPGQYQ